MHVCLYEAGLHVRSQFLNQLVTYTENFTKFDRVFFEICEQTGTQTDRQTETCWSQYFVIYQVEVITLKGSRTRRLACHEINLEKKDR